LSYEYILNKYTGFGASISFNLDDEFSEYQAYAFTPYFRQYFFNKKDFGARGFFVEGNLQFAGGTDRSYYDYEDDFRRTDDWFNAGIGVMLGQKWVSNNGFVFEINIDGGRYLIEDESALDAYWRAGILIGYRIF